jgi:cytochrome bd ubiquinol oxidase subunit II
MAAVWFAILAGLLTGYAVLDGFDLGVGTLSPWVARSEEERHTALSAIGPVWDGNEVWLVAWGGALFLSFPRAYAVALSGFYLPIMIALWLLMGRGVALEFRHHVQDPLWRGACDALFWLSSLLLAFLYGVAVGNVVGGVPFDARGYFQGLFDWMLNPYALAMGLFSLVVLAWHGARYLCLKTAGVVYVRAHHVAASLWAVTALLAVALTVATFAVRPAFLRNFEALPVLLVFPVLAAVGLSLAPRYHKLEADRAAFLCSGAVIVGLLASTAAGLYPDLLPSSLDASRSLTIANAAAPPGALWPALLWMIPAVVLLGVSQSLVYRVFAGRVIPAEHAHLHSTSTQRPPA